MGMFEYGIDLSTASSEKDMQIAKTAYCAGQDLIKSKILDIMGRDGEYRDPVEVFINIRKLVEDKNE